MYGIGIALAGAQSPKRKADRQQRDEADARQVAGVSKAALRQKELVLMRGRETLRRPCALTCEPDAATDQQ